MATDRPDYPWPDDAIAEKFLAATGPGGQNVNKVATACQLRCNVFALGLSPHAYAQLKTIAGSKFAFQMHTKFCLSPAYTLRCSDRAKPWACG